MANYPTLFIPIKNSAQDSLKNSLTTDRVRNFHEFVQYFYGKDFPKFLDRMMAKKVDKKRKIAPSAKRRVQLIQKLIEKNLADNLAENLQLGAIAKYLGLSDSYVSRLFKQETGVNITTYQNQQRIEKVKELLINTSYSLIQIAQDCGFSDDSYLCKRFKALTDMTPTQFREKFQKEIDV